MTQPVRPQRMALKAAAAAAAAVPLPLPIPLQARARLAMARRLTTWMGQVSTVGAFSLSRSHHACSSPHIHHHACSSPHIHPCRVFKHSLVHAAPRKLRRHMGWSDQDRVRVCACDGEGKSATHTFARAKSATVTTSSLLLWCCQVQAPRTSA